MPDLRCSDQELDAIKRWFDHRRKQRVARAAIYRAITAGRLIKPDACSKCERRIFSKSDLQGHHSDYDKPLDVTWVCALCHKAIHREIEKSV